MGTCAAPGRPSQSCVLAPESAVFGPSGAGGTQVRLKRSTDRHETRRVRYNPNPGHGVA